MSIDSRLARLLPALNARERAVLALRARNAGETEPVPRGSIPDHLRHDFNRYMGLAFVTGCQFSTIVHVLQSQIENLSFNLDRIDLLQRAATMLEEDDPESVAARPVRPWRRRVRQSDSVTVPEFLRSLAAEIREDAFNELSFRWQELRAVELVTAEIAETFDGEDPLQPKVRQWLEETKERAKEHLARLGRKRLLEPGEAHLEHTHKLVNNGFAALGLTEE